MTQALPHGQFFPLPGLGLTATATGSRYTGRNDLVIFALPPGANTAACFTQNTFAAAPVQLAKTCLASCQPRYWLINAGNANAATGAEGLANAGKLCALLARRYGCRVAEVLPFSTGVIGEQLPLDAPDNGFATSIAALPDKLDTADWPTAAQAIMTTDTRQKGTSLRVEALGDSFVINGIAKGSGMICPNMATMLAFVVTDLSIRPKLLHKLLRQCLASSFNAISVDGDTSTNDALAIAALGTSALPPLEDGDTLCLAFQHHLQGLCESLALAIVRDGEGMTKLLCVEIVGCRSRTEGRQVAERIAHSPLVKTALFASDPNWGRIACAIGNAPIAGLEPQLVDLYIDDLCIMRSGRRHPDYTEEQGQRYFAQSELWLKVHLHRGNASYRMFTNDLSHQYIHINAAYRS